MPNRKSQGRSNGGNEQSEPKEEKGYMPIYHELEELTYGPESSLDRNTKVFLCIRHATFRDDKSRKYIFKDFIMQKTGLDKSEVERALKQLEKKEMILVHRSKTGKVWNPNEYELHPRLFGKHLNWYKNNPPKLAVIKGGRTYPQESSSYPQKQKSTHGVPADNTGDIPVNNRVGVPVNDRGENPLKFAELMEKIASNNPCIKNPKKRTQENPDSHFLNSEKPKTKDRGEQKQWLNETNGEIDFEQWKAKRAHS